MTKPVYAAPRGAKQLDLSAFAQFRPRVATSPHGVNCTRRPKEPTLSTLLAELSKKAQELPPEERAQLAQELLDSVDQEADPDVQAAWEAEIASRISAYERGEAMLVSAEARRSHRPAPRACLRAGR